jgi:two-component system, cell cycle response regulator
LRPPVQFTSQQAVLFAVGNAPRLLLIDSNEAGRTVLAERLRLQGFTVVECSDGAEGAVLSLEDPPAAVVADLTMPSISGVQLCRLLGSEMGTSTVPVILRGEEGRRNHFWAEQAGAFAYVPKGRMGELVRALRRAIDERREEGDFFVVSSTEGLDVRERIATHLDAALFDSVIAAEVRRLGTSESFDRLADLLSQFVSQVTTYRWIAIARREPLRLAVHVNSASRELAVVEARAALRLPDNTPVVLIEDDDAVCDPVGPPPMLEAVSFGEQNIGTFALAPRVPEHKNDRLLVATIARELGGALRMATLVEESRWMATTDLLTGLLNRRAFLESTGREVARTKRYNDCLSVILLDVDHFKHINDKRGHAAGDMVLAAVGKLLIAALRTCDIVARWGGEEFVLVLPSTSLSGAELVAERVRELMENAEIKDGNGDAIPVTASFGVAGYALGETLEQVIDRADRAMYLAKSGGRNRVICDTPLIAKSESAAE